MKKETKKSYKFLEIFRRDDSGENKNQQLEAENIENAFQLRDALNSLPDIAFQVDKNMRIVWANEKLLDEKPDVIGSYCPELCNASDILHLGCYCKKAIETGEIYKSNIYKPDSDGIYGKKFWEGTGIPIKNNTGGIIGALGILKDITPMMEQTKLDFLTGSGKVGLNNLVAQTEQNQSRNSFFEDVISNLSVGLIVFDNFRRIKFWNPYMEQMTGHKPADVTDKIFEEIFIFTESKDSEVAFEKTSNGETYFIQDAEIELKSNGKKLWITGNVVPKYSSGEKLGSILTIRYYRENLVSQNLLHETEETLSALIISSPAAIMILDKDSNVRIWNPAAEKMFGWQESEVLGKKNPIVQPEHSRDFHNIFEGVMLGKTISNQEIVRNRKDGQRVFISISASPLRDSSGEIIGVVGILNDISEAKLSEEALKESEVRYRSFVQNFQGIAYRLQPDRTLSFINGAVESITGYSEEEFLSGTLVWRSIIHPDDLYKITEFDDKIGTLPGLELDIEYRIIKKDKSIRWVHEFLQNITDRHSRVISIQGTFQDITLRKEAEEELKRSREHLRNLALHLESTREEEKKHIAFEIHDELGHALTALKLELSWIIKKKHLRQEVLSERVKKMSDLIDQTIRKVRTISSELRPSVLDHFGLVAAVEWQTAEFQKRSAVRCRLNIQQTDFKLDENRSIALFRILQETLTNVARHAQATRVDVGLEKSDGNIILRVSDNGRGIKQEQINNRKSFGLIGMVERANAFGGKVSISGVIGIGTTVTIQIPISD